MYLSRIWFKMILQATSKSDSFLATIEVGRKNAAGV